jgi:hypothetical protein
VGVALDVALDVRLGEGVGVGVAFFVMIGPWGLDCKRVVCYLFFYARFCGIEGRTVNESKAKGVSGEVARGLLNPTVTTFPLAL